MMTDIAEKGLAGFASDLDLKHTGLKTMLNAMNAGFCSSDTSYEEIQVFLECAERYAAEIEKIVNSMYQTAGMKKGVVT